MAFAGGDVRAAPDHYTLAQVTDGAARVPYHPSAEEATDGSTHLMARQGKVFAHRALGKKSGRRRGPREREVSMARPRLAWAATLAAVLAGSPACNAGTDGTDGSGGGGGGGGSGTVPTIGGCAILAADHLFNTPIEDLPVHPSSAQFLATIGASNLHLDLGRETDQAAGDYYGIPYNVVHGGAQAWTPVAYGSPDPDMSWNPRAESDCKASAAGPVFSPCAAAAAPTPVFPIPAAPLVEGGISTASDHQPYGDHHLLLLDADACFLWELYHVYHPSRGWEIFGSAVFDLRSNALRPAGWTSADAAGFPILPLLLRADEAGSGTIRHALRFTIQSSKIREEYTWPARHHAGNGGTSAAKPPMGQLFRLRKSYPIPSTFHVQSRAILQAMKTYGMYIADGGSDMYVQGEPSAAWAEEILGEVQSVSSAEFEAVDLGPLRSRAGFDPDSARVPPP